MQGVLGSLNYDTVAQQLLGFRVDLHDFFFDFYSVVLIVDAFQKLGFKGEILKTLLILIFRLRDLEHHFIVTIVIDLKHYRFPTFGYLFNVSNVAELLRKTQVIDDLLLCFQGLGLGLALLREHQCLILCYLFEFLLSKVFIDL